MTDLVHVFLILLLISATAFCIYAIIYLKKITSHVEAVRKDVHNLVERTSPVLENLETATIKVNRIVSEIENYWTEIDESIKDLRERISGFTSFKRFAEVENPAKDIIKNIRAFSRGITTFWNVFKGR